MSLPERFWAKVEHFGECWLWMGSRTPLGYGMMRVGGRATGKLLYAHRLAYEDARGPIPAGLELDHLCRNPPCVNPAHLEAVSHAQNVRRGVSPAASRARQTHCLRGHEYTPANTIIKQGWRSCRTCSNTRRLGKRDPAYWRAYRARRRLVDPDYRRVLR